MYLDESTCSNKGRAANRFSVDASNSRFPSSCFFMFYGALFLAPQASILVSLLPYFVQ